jgi:putative membrane protein
MENVKMKKISIFSAMPVASFLLLAGGVAHAAAASHLSKLDKAFIKKSAQSNLEEIQLSPMIIQRTKLPQDDQFARRMISDHTKNEDLLKGVAAQVGATLPQSISKEQKGIIHKLITEPPATFQSAYRSEMIRDHTIDINECRREMSLGTNPKVREYAQETLPVLEMHLKMSRALPASSAGNGDNAQGTASKSNK